MSRTHDPTSEAVVEEYVLDVRVVERDTTSDESPRYRFEAPDHAGVTFDDPDSARLYADVYFDVNGFVESGTGDRGVPPEIVQAGKDTLAAYLVARSDTGVRWVASFYGVATSEVERYVSWVRQRADEIRERVEARGPE